MFYSNGIQKHASSWLKHKDMAIATCSDGIKPVTFKLEAADIDADVLDEDTLSS